MPCGFGAVRVGALLGRLRLHLQTERFLAVHRGDTMWERGCLGATLALAVMVAGMQETELDAGLLSSPQSQSHLSEVEGWGTSETCSGRENGRDGHARGAR